MKLQRQVKEEQLQKEEIENSLMYMQKVNKEIENKMKIIEKENLSLRQSFKIVNDKIPELDFLKIKIENMEKDINYKDSIIQYLEEILKENKSKGKINKKIYKYKFLFLFFLVTANDNNLYGNENFITLSNNFTPSKIINRIK